MNSPFYAQVRQLSVLLVALLTHKIKLGCESANQLEATLVCFWHTPLEPIIKEQMSAALMTL